jgi:cob(I)alamin adenosyltransferase
MESDPNAYQRKVEKIRQSYEQRKAEATREKGLIVVFTGSGKGKSTAAFGMLLRALHHGQRCAVIQFVKGAMPTGEVEAIKRFGPQVDWHRMGHGFHWNTQDREQDRAAARAAWDKALELMAQPDLGMLLLDEINVAIRLEQLPLEDVLAALRIKPPMLHVVLTGRNAKDELIELADLVTEMKMVKHPYRAGIKAQPGVEY